MSDRAAFLRTIAEQRFSVLPRLVYADWLDEHGDDQPTDAKRAELIRASQYLAESEEEHRPATYCDCDRCRLHRRVTELRDEGVDNITDTCPGLSLIVTGWTLSHGMPVAAKANNTRSLPISDNRVGMEIARLFLAWPLVALTVQFDEPRGENVRWRMEVTVRQPPIEGKQGAAVRVDLTPETFDPAETFRGILSSDDRYVPNPRFARSGELFAPVLNDEWVSQDQWTVTEHRVVPTLAKVPDAVRRAVKKVAAERWSTRDNESRSRATRVVDSMLADGWRPGRSRSR